jgi:hypothetical protein
MRVVAMVGVLMFGLADGFYEMSMDVWDVEGTDSGQVQSFEGDYPPPPSFP